MIEITHQEAHSLLQAAVDQLLRPEEKSVLDTHLSNCKDCSDFAQEIFELETSLRKRLHTSWDKQQPDLNLQTILHPSPVKLLWNNFLSQPNLMGKATIVAALLLGYVVVANLLGIQAPIANGETATALPTPNESASMYSISPTPSAQFILTGSVSQSCGTVMYSVQENDTLESIALQYGTTSESIREHNNLTSDTVFTGTELVIPLCESTPSHTATLSEGTIAITPMNGTLLPTQPQ